MNPTAPCVVDFFAGSGLAHEAAIGYAQLESGQTVSVDSKEQFIDLVRHEPWNSGSRKKQIPSGKGSHAPVVIRGTPHQDPVEQKFLQLPGQPCMISAMEFEITGRELLWETIQQRENYPIFRLTYVSCAVELLTEADLDDIESKSLVANDARDVTGLLIVNGRRIMQILEGRESAVLELYEKIRKDPRHVIAKLVSTVEDEGRMLLTWNMVVRDVNSIPVEVLKQYNELYDELLNANEPRIITIDDVDFLKSVALFSALPA